MADLRPCTGCLRHVRIDETRCPFCAIALPLAAPSPAISEARLGRAARMALGAAMATASLAGCGNSSSGASTTGNAPIAAESSRAAATSEPTTRAATRVEPAAPAPAGTPNPFLVTGTPTANTAAADTGSAPPPPTATTVSTAKPLPTGTQKVQTVQTVQTAHRNWGNIAKPYGAPPADGLIRSV